MHERPVGRSLGTNGHWDMTLVRTLEKVLRCWENNFYVLRSLKLTARAVEILSFVCYSCECSKEKTAGSQHALYLTRGRQRYQCIKTKEERQYV